MAKNVNTDVLIIGAGASGLTAAIFAAEKGASVVVVEHGPKAAKKILLTGNGRCNLSNTTFERGVYRGADPAFAHRVLEGFTPDDTLDFFHESGILTTVEQGRVYPSTFEGNLVSEVLIKRLDESGAGLFLNAGIYDLHKSDAGFLATIESEDESGKNKFKVNSKTLILACGGASYPKTGSDGSGYNMAKSFGHRLNPVFPALCHLVSKEDYPQSLHGVRAISRVSLFIDGSKSATEVGEVQFTKKGISGVPVLSLSRFASKALSEGGKVELSVDFAADMDEKKLRDELSRRKNSFPSRSAGDLLSGIVHRKTAVLICRLCRVKPSDRCSSVKDGILSKMTDCVKNFRMEIIGTSPLEEAQCTAGGIDVSDVNPSDMQSILCPGLFFAGEMLDVDGTCGGYNLQFAWSSGALAGMAAANISRKDNS
ncbi:MAG: NAD(P)/FAD-dependent oxidoreductase [Eubacterium sp.]|nr:NAD(P)/FAD-dependent oxidoreductase [Eubacterium sp.]